MSLFRKIFGRRQFQRFPDSFTLTQSRKWTTLCEWVDGQVRVDRDVLVLTHFPSTFVKTQSALQEADIDFEVLSSPIASDMLMRQFEHHATRTLITMAQMLAPATALSTESTPQRELSVIVMERYPLLENDRLLENYLRQVSARVSAGYLVSFDDPVLRHLMGERFVNLMKQLGMGDNDLVSSTMTHRGFSRRLRAATSRITEEIPANSPEEWIQQNLQ